MFLPRVDSLSIVSPARNGYSEFEEYAEREAVKQVQVAPSHCDGICYRIYRML